MIELIKRYWILVAVLGFLLTFSSQIQAMWNAPQKTDEYYQKTQEQLQQTFQAQQDYYVQQRVANERWEQRWQQQERVNSQYYEWLRDLQQ